MPRQDGFSEAVVSCDMPELYNFYKCHKRFPWTHKEVDLAPHPVVSLVLQVGDMDKFPQALGFDILDPFFRVSKQSPCFTATEEDGGDKRHAQLELACKADGVHRQILFSLAIAVIAEAILRRTSAEEVPSLQRVAPRLHFWPFILISALMLFVLLAMILLFSVLTSIPYAVTLSTSLLVRS